MRYCLILRHIKAFPKVEWGSLNPITATPVLLPVDGRIFVIMHSFERQLKVSNWEKVTIKNKGIRVIRRSDWGVGLVIYYGRNPSSAGIFVGVVFLVSLQKALEFGQSLGAAGKIPPWLGIWGIIAAVAIFAFVLFWKSAYKMGQPPLTSFSHWVGHIKGEIINGIQSLTGRKHVNRDV